MSFQDVVTEDQRLVILRAMQESHGQSNDSVLQKILARFGHRVSRDKVKTHLHWLHENELVSIESLMNTDVATLTGRGHDVASGLAKVPGVGTPRPGA